MSSKCFERLTLQADACGVTRLQARALLQIRQRTEISVIPARAHRCAINEIERPRAGVGHAVSDALARTSTPARMRGPEAIAGGYPTELLPRRGCHTGT